MQTTRSSKLAGLEAYAPRIARRRARDPYFDGLCSAYQDVTAQLDSAHANKYPLTRADIDRLTHQRTAFLDTILFLLEDHDAMTRHAA